MKLTIILIIIFSCAVLLAQTDSLQLKEFKRTLENFENKVDQVITNQINYKIEKDLIKETYSSNYSRIQLIITVAIGIFTVLGLLGLNSINKIKNNYEIELIKLTTLKTKLEQDYKKLSENQLLVEKTIETIKTSDQEQDKKLKVLEVREKAEALFRNNAYLPALEYITIGLELDPKNIILKHLKATAYYGLLEYYSAIAIHKDVLSVDPKNNSSIEDLAELLLFVNDMEGFINLKKKYLKELNLDYSKPLTVYYEVLYNYNSDKLQEMEQTINEFLDNYDENYKEPFLDWNYSDINNFLKLKDNDLKKTVLNYFVNVLKGSWSKLDYNQNLTKEKGENKK